MHRYGTRANLKKRMEDQRQEKVENDIKELKGSMLKLMEMMQVLTAARESATQNPKVPEDTTTIVEPHRPGASWPEFGLP